MDGYVVLRRLRAARVRTPVLILSGLNTLNDKASPRSLQTSWRRLQSATRA
jgi:DNA-binding response OmpR family regulator